MPNRTHNQRNTADWQALDAAHHLHPFSDMKQLNAAGSRVIVRAEGIHIVDSDGNRVIDVPNGVTTTGTQLDIWDYLGGTPQRWLIQAP